MEVTLTLRHGDCLEIMKSIPDKSVDLIICDLPYGCLGGGGIATMSEEERKKSEAEGGSDPVAAAKKKYLASAESFMKSDSNSIVKSFRSAGGRGLAGFIDSMSFDWMAGTWDTSDGRKAPKMCKVTISFTPIHDITPGLDANGQNRAPIYPIGPYSTGE